MKQSVTFVPLFALCTLLFAVFSLPVYADTACQPIYGGGETCPGNEKILINKTVQHPKTKTYVDNVGATEDKYAPDSEIKFQITITNTDSRAVEKIVVKDALPKEVRYVSSDRKSSTKAPNLTFTLDKIDPEKSVTITIVGKTVPLDQLPANQGIVCPINQSSLTVNNRTYHDSALFCIQKQVLTQQTQPDQPGTTKGGLPLFPAVESPTTPSTGPEALALFSLLPAAVSGFYLRRKTQ